MRTVLALLAAALGAASASDVCGSAPSTQDFAISGPTYGSNAADSASECCERCDRAGNICIAWSFEKKLCKMFNYFSKSDVHPSKGASYGQLRKTVSVLNPSPSSPPKGAKNVLFLIADDMRPSLPFYGLKEGFAPNLGRLAEGGAQFQHAYVQFSYCAPSRQSIITGRRPDATKSFSFMDDFREFGVGNQWLSMPQAFKARGYYSFGAGKVFHEGVPANYDLPYSWSTPDYVDRGGNATNQCRDECCGVPKEEQSIWCMWDLKPGTLLPDQVSTASAISHLEEAATRFRSSGQPFFGALGLHKPHLRWDFPRHFLDNITEAVPTARVDAWPDDIPHLHWHECAEMSVGGMWNSQGWGVPPPSQAYQSHARRAYYAAIAYADSLFGQILDRLDALGLANDTIVVATADHGWSLYEADVTCKMTPDERGNRVPLIIRDPSRPASHGKLVSSLAEGVDVFPTLFDLATGAPPSGPGMEAIGGVSLRPVLDDPSASVKEVALSQMPRCFQNLSSVTFDDTRGWPGDENNHTTSWESMSDCHWVHRDSINFMGYTMRTEGSDLGSWRYTEWATWDGQALRPDWTRLAGRELFNHTGDDGMAWVYDDAAVGEYENLVGRPELANKVAQLSARLHAEVDKYITPNPAPAPFNG